MRVISLDALIPSTMAVTLMVMRIMINCNEEDDEEEVREGEKKKHRREIRNG